MPKSDTGVPGSSWTTTAACDASTFKSRIHLPKPLPPKSAFETFATKHGIKIQHYHCNNSRFSDNAFKQACHDARQQLTFCGVNAHFKNGIAKRSTRNLSESTHKQLLHARACWGRQFTLCCGNMPCAMLHSSTIVCQCWRMANQG